MSRTYEESFRARLVLQAAQRHLANRAACYDQTRGLQIDGASEWRAFLLINKLLLELESEFCKKRSEKRARPKAGAA